MRRGALIVFGILCIATPAWAQPDDAPAGIEPQAGAAAGGPLGLAVPGTKNETTAPFTGYVWLRLRLPRVTPLALEVSAIPGHGFGLNVLTDVIHIGRFRLHFFDIGFFWDAFEPVSVRRVDRNWDLTLGTGLEARMTARWSLTLDWRTFLPSPFTVITDYGDFSRLVFQEALKGGQTWLGVSYSW